MFNKIWNFWNDIILTCYGWWWLPVGLAAMGGLYWYSRRSFYNKEIQFNGWV